MTTDTFQTPLLETGLTPHQAALYEALLRSGPISASKATQLANVPRTLGYVVLDQLVELGLITKSKADGAKTLFSPLHPGALADRTEAALKTAERAKAVLTSILPELSSAYNLATGRPGVRFYEGIDGIKQVLEDTLTAKETIYSYADLEMIDRNIGEINRAYVQKRERLGLKKRALLLDSQENRFLLEGYHIKITDVKLINAATAPFKTVMQIYDGRISYFTLGVQQLVGVIITDQHIYEMHKALFEFIWDSPLAKPLTQDVGNSKTA